VDSTSGKRTIPLSEAKQRITTELNERAELYKMKSQDDLRKHAVKVLQEVQQKYIEAHDAGNIDDATFMRIRGEANSLLYVKYEACFKQFKEKNSWADCVPCIADADKTFREEAGHLLEKNLYSVNSGKPTENSKSETPDDWLSYEISNAFSISVPPSIERQQKYDKYTKQISALTGYVFDNKSLIFQQKGLADANPIALKQYCRVIIQYSDGNKGDYMKSSESEIIDAETRNFLYDLAVATSKPYTLIGNPKYEWVSIGSVKALKTTYRRNGAGGDGPVACVIYILQNEVEMAKIVLSYREDEAPLWKRDFNTVINSFRWKYKH
jgi:hypothetical protein